MSIAERFAAEGVVELDDEDGAETRHAVVEFEIDTPSAVTIRRLGVASPRRQAIVLDADDDITLRGSWPGAPADFEIVRLAGVLHFLSTDGRLTQVAPGLAGHVFGLLTITSLPRRLLLDFGDLFREGIGYDRMEGSFAIENGNAYTDNLFVESDPARFEVVGRTGLVQKDYDQIVTIIPKVSSSLPLVPIWLAQKILNRNLFDKAFAYQYTIAGTWDDPQMELVRTSGPGERPPN